jgi:light-regulated signal transduction histidine kinase (bacteriophytochrome)
VEEVRVLRVEDDPADAQLLRRARDVEAAQAHIERQAAQLQARAEQLQRLHQELDDFAYIASHDLKEPLRGIRTHCELLLEDYASKLDEPGQRRLHKLVDLCERLENLIGDLLTYCRVGGVRPAQTGIDLEEVVGEVLETLAPVIERQNAAVRIERRLPTVTGDAMLIGLVLANLISNGLKFNDSPQPRVEIGALPTDPPTLYVRDNGIGIPREHHEAVFSIFRRLHSRAKYEGSGVGLTIVRKIVQSHGGRVWLESEVGAGSTFFFTLGPGEEKPAAAPTLRPPHWAEHPQAHAPCRPEAAERL